MFRALLPLWGKKSLPKKSLVCHISLHFYSYIQIGQRASTVRFSSIAHCPFLGFFTNFMSPLFILSLSWDFFSSMLSSFKFPKTSEKYLTLHKSFAKSTVHPFTGNEPYSFQNTKFFKNPSNIFQHTNHTNSIPMQDRTKN